MAGFLAADQPQSKVAAILKRAGFYHDVLKGRDTGRSWQAVKERFGEKQVSVTTLMLLYGCEFDQEFSIGGNRIRQFTGDELASLSPTQEVCQSFFQTEHPNRWRVFENFWFIQHEAKEPAGLEGLDSEDEDYSDYFLFDSGYWDLILPIILYSSGFFDIPVILQSEPGWTSDPSRRNGHQSSGVRILSRSRAISMFSSSSS